MPTRVKEFKEDYIKRAQSAEMKAHQLEVRINNLRNGGFWRRMMFLFGYEKEV